MQVNANELTNENRPRSLKSLLRRLTNSTEVSKLSTVGHRVLVLFLIMILLLLSTLMQQYLKVQETTLLELATRLLPGSLNSSQSDS